jgi:alcohol dehydrogenase class IV
MDTAKALGARIAHPRKSLKQMGGILRIYKSLPTFIAIPTTAGTGSETTLAAIITEPKTHHKYALMSFPLIPHYAVLDPRMTVTLPAHLTATTGLDALTHAIEAFIGRSTTRETRQLAIDAVKLIFANIEHAYKNGSDLKARENMLIASFKAGLAFSKSYVGYVHAVAHSLGGKYNTPHGLANAVLLTHVLEEYGEIVYTKLATLAKAANISSENDTPEFAADKFIKAIKALNKKLGIPERIEAIIPSDIPELARHAEKEANPLYPVPKLMTAKELEKFYHLVK